ncbi:MAG: hypothetical protein Q8L41_13170 [Anaerolineales bacterium]|nr:hypothetical protein [Anaerolineales bacterium]
MKKTAFYLLIGLLVVSAVTTRPVLAQTERPPAGALGKVMGTIINQNTGTVVAEEMDVMLHVLDQDFTDAGMLHGQSQSDGTFLFTDVAFDEQLQYAVMATYDGVTYFSETTAVDLTSMQVALDVPVYESTSDLAGVQVDQMHVLFNFAEDGLETKEIYILSNNGERTVKDVYKLEGDKSATFKFPLPSGADFIFFKPDDQDRFVKFDGGFADTYPILPGTRSAQIMVNYLVPFSEEGTYSYTAPLNIARMNLLIEQDANMSLQGRGLAGPEQMALQDGKSYLIYSYSDLRAGQTVEVSFSGQVNSEDKMVKEPTIPLASGAAFLGIAMIGFGVWWWRRPGNDQGEDDEIDVQAGGTTLDELIAEIARLDEEHERGSLSSEEHQHQRQELMQRAKRLL